MDEDTKEFIKEIQQTYRQAFGEAKDEFEKKMEEIDSIVEDFFQSMLHPATFSCETCGDIFECWQCCENHEEIAACSPEDDQTEGPLPEQEKESG